MMDNKLNVYRQASKESENENSRATKGTQGSSGTNVQRKQQHSNSHQNETEKSKRITEGQGTPEITSASRKDKGDATFSEIYLSGLNQTHGAVGADTTGIASQMNKSNTTQQQNANYRHLSNKSDSNLNSNTNNSTFVGNQKAYEKIAKKEQSEGKKKRKNSDKTTQRRASNNRKGDPQKEGLNIPPIDSSANNHDRRSNGEHSGPQRSHSRGTGNTQNSQGNNIQNQQQPNYLNNQFFEQSNQNHQYNPFQQNHNFQQTFPFGNNNAQGPFIGGQQAPQVHFIARKQQFIAQISPDQLTGGDKRPYTAQSLNNLSASTKRAGGVYGNALASGGKQNGTGAYNLANAAFANHPAVYLGAVGSRTHTTGFSFHPNGQQHKYSQSIYGEDVRPKVGGKDLMKGLGASNGFSSCYGSDPYNSVMSSGLPNSISHSTRPTKAKAAGGRLQGKEKEQLYDETIKMKMLNNQLKEEHVKLKTKVKILENELGRKEKTIEDLFSHNQLIQQSQSKHQATSNPSLLPLAQTAQKYQQETFLVMSLKKQIRELKYEVVKRDEELEVLRKNIKNTRTQEFEQELQTYHDECLRLRSLTEELLKQGGAHPLHQQAVMERVQEMEGQLAQRDILIQQLSENRSSQSQILGDHDGHLASAQPSQSAAFPGIGSQGSQHFESHPSELAPGATSSTQGPGQTQGVPGRDKSGERKQQLAPAPGAPQKDAARDLQKAKKAIREKDKEIAKVKVEIAQLKREQIEKAKNGQAASKDVEAQVKSLRDKLKEQKGEARRRDDRLGESEAKLKRLEETLHSMAETLKQSEDSNKSLKAQLRTAKHQKTKPTESIPTVSSPEAPATASKQSLTPLRAKEKSAEKSRPAVPKEELALVTLIGQREKLCRDDLTAMMMAGEDSLKMLIKEPSEQLVEFVQANLEDEDALLAGIPRFEVPKTDFESQVLREMRIVLKENAQRIADKTKEELMTWTAFEEFYSGLENFEYPHKDKLLEFVKYFFLDHIVSKDILMINYQAFKEHLAARRPPGATPEKSRNGSNLRSGRRSRDSSGSFDDSRKRNPLHLTQGSDGDKAQDEERMLDIAEQCFMRIADLLHLAQKTVRSVFLRYSQPELFKDGSVLELMSPRGFLEGVRDIGFDDVTELEAACLMKVLAKPELENSVILNEFVLIMENFGVPVIPEEDEFENDYIPDTDAEESTMEEDKLKQLDEKRDSKLLDQPQEQHKKFAEIKKGKNAIHLKPEIIDDKGNKILKKLARFLLERYMHPREFFGPTIKKETIGQKKNKVEVIKLHDFYLRLKLASIRKKLKENVSINLFLAIDGDKYPGFIQVKKMIKALEMIAEKEQELLVKEQEEKHEAIKLKIQTMQEERKEKGEPPLSEEEIADLIASPKEKEKGKAKDKMEESKTKDEGDKKKPKIGALDEMLKLGGEKGKAKSRFASQLGPGGQLNTIEEDLHETQTSHYSMYQKEGDQSDREGSMHQLSTHLRNSKALNEMEDSSRRSKQGSLAIGKSVHSGDYSGGSLSSDKKKKAKDIENSDINIESFKDFKKKKSIDPKLHSTDRPQAPIPDSLRKYSIKEEKNEDDQNPMNMANMSAKNNKRGSLANNQHNSVKISQNSKFKDEINKDSDKEEDDYEMDLEEVEQKMKDELETEVNRKIEKMHSQQIEETDDYEDEMTYQREGTPPANKSFEILKEDTIKTDKINEIMEEEDKLREQDNYILEQNEYEKDLDNVDIVEDINQSRQLNRNSIPSYKLQEEIIEEEVDNHFQAQQIQDEKKSDSSVEEDYAF